ncbi:hypothetical protein FJZ18_01795 [Candidatus Pacearchaeota archaeon]|nr:hypothetical protein [Candidatus Pacearchaeota archaeon]
MPPLSQQKKDKIQELILHYLFTLSPQSAFTVQISREIARDEEFTLSLLQDLKKKHLIIEIAKNKDGTDYKKRRRWRLSNEVYDIYKKKQDTKPSIL